MKCLKYSTESITVHGGEREKHCQWPFLYMLVERNADNTITTRWYKKLIASGRILNYNSLHPLKTKISTAYGLIDREARLTSNSTTYRIEQTITDILSTNGYPKSLINRLFCRYFNRKQSQSK